jgi:hypothetical protein
MSAILILFAFIIGCSPTRIYIVRDAEKVLDGSRNPTLTFEGEARAKTLASVLKNRKIERFYTTETLSAVTTAQPLATIMRKSILHFSTDTLPQFIIKVLDSASNTLIVGQANDVLKILYEMGLNPTFKELGDNQYDNLFIVFLRNQNGRVGYKMSLLETHFGKSSKEKTSN